MTSNQFVINNSAKAYLLDTSQPFNEEKVKLLDEVVNALYGNDTSMVSYSHNWKFFTTNFGQWSLGG